MKGLISVIVPAYNVDEYLSDSLNSLLNQTYQNFEVTIIDDGSTDQTYNTIQELVGNDDRFTILTQRNAGISYTRNKGLALSKGEFIYFFDSDDRLKPNFFKDAVEVITKSKSDIFTFNAISFFDNETDANHFSNDTYIREVNQKEDVVSYFLQTEQFRSPAWLYFYRKSFLTKLGMSFSEGFLHEDEAYSLILNVEAEKVCFKPECYFERRVRAGSIMTAEKTIRNTIGYFEAFKQSGYWYQTSNRIAQINYAKAVKDRVAMFYLWALRGAIRRGELHEFRKMAFKHLPLIFKMVRVKHALAILFPMRLCRILSR